MSKAHQPALRQSYHQRLSVMQSQAQPPPLGTKPVEVADHTNINRFERLVSLLGGGALAAWSLRRYTMPRVLLAATGSLLAARGLTGHSRVYEALGLDTSLPGSKARAVRLEEATTIYRPRDEVYAFWRDLSNLPRFMHHLEQVVELEDGRSRWTARVPKGLGTLSWEAQITREEQGTLLAWQSLPDSEVANAGTVQFSKGTGPLSKGTGPRAGTEVHVEIHYSPPPGEVGTLVANLLQPLDEKLIREDMRRFKHLMEAGEVPTNEGQPACR